MTDGAITLAWPTGNTNTVLSYNIYRGTASGAETELDGSSYEVYYGSSLGAIDVATFTDTSVVSGVTYYYTVQAGPSILTHIVGKKYTDHQRMVT